MPVNVCHHSFQRNTFSPHLFSHLFSYLLLSFPSSSFPTVPLSYFLLSPLTPALLSSLLTTLLDTRLLPPPFSSPHLSFTPHSALPPPLLSFTPDSLPPPFRPPSTSSPDPLSSPSLPLPISLLLSLPVLSSPSSSALLSSSPLNAFHFQRFLVCYSRCYAGFSGANCSIASCPAVNNCSGQGVCQEANFCKCDVGYTGADCSIVSCEGVNYCSGETGLLF